MQESTQTFALVCGFTLTVILSLLFAPSCTPGNEQYHTYQELDEALHLLADQYPDLAAVTSLGITTEGRDIWALKISDQVHADEDEPVAIIVGGHHAREWISVEVPLLIADHLLDAYGSDAHISALVDNAAIWFVPLLNPDGHEYAVTTNRMWRKNRRENKNGSFGVDPNRNYDINWSGPGASSDQAGQTYHGPTPFSEPETQAVRDLVRAQSPSAFISYHSHGQVVFYPWSHTADDAPDMEQLARLAEGMAAEISAVHGVVYRPMQGAGFSVNSGNATDWVYAETSAASFNVEIRTEDESPGFVLPQDQIQPAFEENLKGALYLIEWTVSQNTPSKNGAW